MRDYGKVRTAFWTDEKVKEWDSDRRTLFLYLLTCPHTTALGCFYVPDGYIVADLGWDVPRIYKSVSALCAEGVLHRDRTGWTWLPNYLKHNKPENGSVWKHIRKLAAALPPSVTFKALVLQAIPESGRENEDRPDTLPPPSPPPPPEPNRTQPNLTEPNRAEPGTREARPPRKVGSTLPEGWEPSADDVAYARSRGFGEGQIGDIAADFRGYWTVGQGRNKTHADWAQAWQTWVRKERPRPGGPAPVGPPNGKVPFDPAARAKLLADKARSGNWQWDPDWVPKYGPPPTQAERDEAIAKYLEPPAELRRAKVG